MFTLPFLCNSIIELLNEYSKEAFENGKGVLVKLLINWFHAHGLKMSSESFQEGTSRHNFLPQFTTSTFFISTESHTCISLRFIFVLEVIFGKMLIFFFT